MVAHLWARNTSGGRLAGCVKPVGNHFVQLPVGSILTTLGIEPLRPVTVQSGRARYSHINKRRLESFFGSGGLAVANEKITGAEPGTHRSRTRPPDRPVEVGSPDLGLQLRIDTDGGRPVFPSIDAKAILYFDFNHLALILGATPFTVEDNKCESG